MIRKKIQPNDLVYYGEKDDKYNGGYKPVIISGADLINSIKEEIPAGATGQQGPQGPQGVAGPVGPAGLEWQGAWVSGTSYVADDAVGFGGASYFCINPTSGTTNPSLDTANWALLASQGSPGPQGPQGIAGPAGPSGSGLPGTAYGQTQYWNTASAQWMPTAGLTSSGDQGPWARVGIGTYPVNPWGLRMITNGGGMRLSQSVTGNSLFNQFDTPAATFQFGLNGPNPSNAVFNNSMYFTMNQAHAIKFATAFSSGGGDRLIIQGNGQVVIGAAFAANTTANFIVKQKDIEVEELGRGIILASPDGTRYRISVANGGTVTATAV